MELYNELASNEEGRRITAAEQLVKKILEGKKSGSAENGTELTYALNRLVKGLSSGRESARLGFSIALTELLHELEDIDVVTILDLLEKHTTPSGNISGVEERDFYFGRLFGLTALIQSEILLRPITSQEAISATIKHLVALATKKSWLREPSSKALCSLILTFPRLKNGKEKGEEVFKDLEESGLLRSQDGAAVLLALNSLPKNVKPKLSTKIWQHADPLHPSNLPLLNKVLKDISSEDDVVKSSGSFKGEPHFVWTFILQKYLEKSKDIVGFKSLWDTVVENGFFAPSSSLERKYLGFQLVLLFLPQVPEDLVESLFSQNFLRCLVNHSSAGDRYLNKAAKKSLSTIHSACETRPEITLNVYKGLVGYSTKFDRLTKSKTVEDLYSIIPPVKVESLVDFLWEGLLTPGSSERKWFADQFVIVIRHHLNLLQQQRVIIERCLNLFCQFGFFTSESLGNSDQLMLRERLFSLLSLLISDTTDVWASYAVLQIEMLEEIHKKVIKLDSEIKKIRKAGLKMMKKLRKMRIKNDSHQHRGLEMLFALTLLQLYNGDTEAVSVLQELQALDLNVTEKDTGLLVEIILGFLSKPSNLQRKLSEQVFGSFAPSVTSDGLKLLLDVLLTPETVGGAEDLFDNDAAEDEDDEDAEDEDEEDDDDEEEDEGEESGEDNDEDVDMRMDDDADEELNAALSAALGTTKQLTNGNDESSDEELMDDDEMMALDDNLATIFRQRLKPNRAKEVKDTKLQMATFKCKVIDLLEILVKQHNDLCLEMILPLLHVLRLTKSDSVHSKTMNLLRKLAKSKELPETSENVMGILRKIHEDAAKAKNKDGNIHSQLSIYIARIARKQGQEEEVIGVYAETMQKWVKNRKSMVRAGLFADWLNWCQSIRR